MSPMVVYLISVRTEPLCRSSDTMIFFDLKRGLPVTCNRQKVAVRPCSSSICSMGIGRRATILYFTQPNSCAQARVVIRHFWRFFNMITVTSCCYQF